MLCVFVPHFHEKLVVESDSADIIYWVFSGIRNEMKSLSSQIKVEFKHVGQSTNMFAVSLEKQGVDSLLL